MRIAFLTHEPFYPPSGGGSAEAIYLVEEMIRRGHEVHVFCPEFPDIRAVSERFEVRFHLFTRWEMNRYTAFRNLKYLLYPRELKRMVLEAAEIRPFNLVVAQHTISSVAAGRLRSRLKVPVVMNFLDFLTGFMESWPVWIVPRPVLRRLQRFEMTLPSRALADGIMTVSDPLAEAFAGAGFPLPRIRPIYYGFDADRFSFRGEQAIQGGGGDADSPPVVIMHGSFDQHHLGPVAREAMIELHRRRPEVVFRFVGRETRSLRGLLKDIRVRAPELKTECTGFVPYADVSRQLARATLGMVPYEPSNGAHCAFVAKAVEYLAVGLPVVATRLKNLSRYFKDEPRIRFSGFNGSEFAGEVLRWLEDPALRDGRSARAAADRVRRELDWRVISRRAVDFIEKTKNEFR